MILPIYLADNTSEKPYKDCNRVKGANIVQLGHGPVEEINPRTIEKIVGSQRVLVIRDHPGNIHNRWNNTLPPVTEVNQGDLVVFECRDSSDNQLSSTSTSEDIEKVDSSRVHALTGPVYLRGAEPGDALEVDIVGIAPRYDWGWTALVGHESLLDDPNCIGPYLKVWHFSNGFAHMGKLCVPIAPFMGVMGVAPARRGLIEPLRHLK